MKKTATYLRAMLILLFFALASVNAFPQALRVTGTIRSNTGESMPGVNVVVKGTTNGALSDVNGKYIIDNVSSDAVLEFTFIGYKLQDVPVNSKTVIDVVLEEDMLGLEEVVVIGYGTQKKETLTGAITQIKSEEIMTTKSTSVVSNLQGKLAGVHIRQQSGEPGMFTTMVSVRGFGTPLLVIDGVARDGMSDLERLNPEDIESMSVLKDASAAIYGMNADNGVIIVTTKKGSKGRTQFNFSTLYGVKQPTSMLESVDAYTYRVLKNEMENNIGKPDLFTADDLAKWEAGTEPGYQDYDWINETSQ